MLVTLQFIRMPPSVGTRAKTKRKVIFTAMLRDCSQYRQHWPTFWLLNAMSFTTIIRKFGRMLFNMTHLHEYIRHYLNNKKLSWCWQTRATH